MSYFGIPLRNGVPIGLGSIAGFGVAPAFDPSELFSAGEQGAWYDPSDLTTLFTDSAGTVPVTGVEQFVGMMLDKSKGAPTTLGAELITPAANRDFSSNTGYWTPQDGSITIAGGAANFSSTTNAFALYAAVGAIGAASGKVYSVTFTLVSCSAGAIRFGIGANYGASVSTPGTYTQQIGAGAGGFFGFYAVGTTTASVDNISVRELPGNHATSTGTKRPKLAARYNLLTYTEQFDQGAWTKSNVTVTANVVVAPDGTTTADELVNTAVTNVHDIEQGTITPTIGTLYRITWRVKKSTNRYVALGWWRTTGTAAGAGFDLDTGTVTGTGAIGTDYSATNATIAALGNGWYEIGVTVTGSASLQVAALFHRATAYTGGASTFLGESYAGTTADKTFIWGADLRPASQATGLIGPTYQRVVDAATYDTAGFLPYLQFDGIDDSMSTGNIDFTATDKMTVWAGVRKLSDSTALFVESSALFAINNGSFAIVPASSFAFEARGTASAAASGGAGYTAPTTTVICGTANIFASTTVLRLNGAVNATSLSTLGTGNFGNYPLNIGMRNNTLFPFNGWLTSLIVRGAQSTQSQIEATESWVNGKTGAF